MAKGSERALHLHFSKEYSTLYTVEARIYKVTL